MKKLVAVDGANIQCPMAMNGMESMVLSSTSVQDTACGCSKLTKADKNVPTNIVPFKSSCQLRPVSFYPYVFLPCKPIMTFWRKVAIRSNNLNEMILTEDSYFKCNRGSQPEVHITDPGQDSVFIENGVYEQTDEFFKDLLQFLIDQGIAVDQQRFFNDPEYFQFFFTFSQEIGYGIFSSIEPHWPGGASGVTIGPGYDLKHRTQQQVYDDLVNAGVDPAIAMALSQAAGLSGTAAENFSDNWSLGDISRDDEVNLFQFIIPEYIDRSKRAIDNKYGQGTWDGLDPVQQAMLFDIEYNGGINNYPTFADAVLAEDWPVACVEHVRNSNGQPLGKRTQDFEDLFCA